MSTPDVRISVMTAINAAVPVGMAVFNLSDYTSIDDLPLNTTQEALLVDFIAASEYMTTIAGEGAQGWQEDGTIAMTWIAPTGFVSTPILTKADALRVALRGRRLNKIVLESVEPFRNTGSQVGVNGPWTGFSSLINYTRHDCG